MEESEKRRERLKAMRMEAAQVGINTDSDTSGLPSGGLSNPLIESETVSTTPLPYNSPRFDYYTDPMSAFSGSKRTNNVSPQVSQGHYNIPPRNVNQALTPMPVHQNPAMNSPGQRTFRVPGTHFSHGPFGSSVEAGSPFGRPQGYPPSTWGGSGGSFNCNTPPNMHRVAKFASPSSGHRETHHASYGRGRGQRYNCSSQYDSGSGGSRFPDSGRGRGHSLGKSMSPGSGPSGRRGAGSRDPISAEERPDLYYSKAMVENPWKTLNPVVWKGVQPTDSNKSWLPKSISTKKAKVSSEPSKISVSQGSLAEFLAASFNDSINEAVDDKQGT